MFGCTRKGDGAVFDGAKEEEVSGMKKRDIWDVVEKTDVPSDANILGGCFVLACVVQTELHYMCNVTHTAATAVPKFGVVPRKFATNFSINFGTNFRLFYVLIYALIYDSIE